MTRERRDFSRRAVKLPCTIHTDDGEFHTSTVDISLGGVRLALPAFSKAFLSTPLRAAEIADLPALGVTERWRGTTELGAEFRDPQLARPLIAALIDRLDGETPAEGQRMTGAGPLAPV